MSLLPPAFKDPAFAPLGPPIKRRATFAQMREAYTKAQRYNALEDFESENHGNADTGCLQEPCMPPAGVIAHYREVAKEAPEPKWVCGDWGVDADVAHMREQVKLSDGRATMPSPKLESALANAQAALAEHLFGEAKKVKDPFEKVKAKANVMLQQATSYPTWNDALIRKLLEADAERVCNPSAIVPF